VVSAFPCANTFWIKGRAPFETRFGAESFFSFPQEQKVAGSDSELLHLWKAQRFCSPLSGFGKTDWTSVQSI